MTVSLIINDFCFFNIYLKGNSFCLVAPMILKFTTKFFWFSYIFWQFLLKIMFFFSVWLFFELHFYSCVFVDFPVYVEMAWFQDLNFLNSLSLMINFSAISRSSHSLLVFFILAVFKGAILLTTSIIFWKKLLVASRKLDIFSRLNFEDLFQNHS